MSGNHIALHEKIHPLSSLQHLYEAVRWKNKADSKGTSGKKEGGEYSCFFI